VTRTAIVTDSTADLPSSLAADHGITVVPLTLHLDGRPYLDGIEITAGEFYSRLGAASAHPSTSQPSPGQFKEVYERLLEDHDEVVSIHISGRLSGTLQSAEAAAQLVDRRRVHTLDSDFVSMPLAALALVAARLAAQDANASDAIAEVARVREAMRCYFAVATLEYLRRGGRIGAASALLGSVLQVKPILTIEGGQVAPLERVRTTDRALTRIVELSSDLATGPVCAIVGHAAAEPAALTIAERLETISETLIVQPLGPVVGAHAGPGTVGLAVYPAELFPLRLRYGVPEPARA
jgi:DegV family protein with EDD domain